MGWGFERGRGAEKSIHHYANVPAPLGIQPNMNIYSSATRRGGGGGEGGLSGKRGGEGGVGERRLDEGGWRGRGRLGPGGQWAVGGTKAGGEEGKKIDSKISINLTHQKSRAKNKKRQQKKILSCNGGGKREIPSSPIPIPKEE